MTAKENIIHKIIESKNKPQLNFSLKQKTEAFTNNLFYTLFDSNACIEKNIEQLEADFKEIYNLAGTNPKNSSSNIWNEFLKTLPEIFENLNMYKKEFLDRLEIFIASSVSDEKVTKGKKKRINAIYLFHKELSDYLLPDKRYVTRNETKEVIKKFLSKSITYSI